MLSKSLKGLAAIMGWHPLRLCIMVGGKAMTKYAKAQIRVLAVRNYTHREIAYEVQYSKSAVGQYLRQVKAQKRGGKRGRRPKMTERMRRAIIRDARSGNFSAR